MLDSNRKDEMIDDSNFIYLSTGTYPQDYIGLQPMVIYHNYYQEITKPWITLEKRPYIIYQLPENLNVNAGIVYEYWEKVPIEIISKSDISRNRYCNDIYVSSFGRIFNRRLKKFINTSKYDDIISFLESLDTNDKRVALGLKTYLIGKYYTIFNLNMSDKKVKEYYKNNKEQIDKNIEKALELNEKFKLNEDGIRDGRLVSKSDDYYDIAYIYKHAGDKEKYEHFNKLYNTYKKVYKPAKSPAYVPPKHLLNSVNKS